MKPSSLTLLPFLFFVGVTYGAGCNHTYDLELRTSMCTLELENEWRPKLKPDDSCARLIDEAKRFVSRFDKGEVQVSKVCTKGDLIKAVENASETISKAREKGWATLEQYLNY
ncbi:hypothetical protein [Pseudomonas sp. LFM046]|uniref:hypothetical protein n=1 Tax=Pseudomonas sp. LFM046 TaxID=1608357 RepID=UPI0011AFBD40|nr:hypothetical protein [Pseudomonas sp. LFM046]